MVHEHGAECGDGSHGDADFSGDNLPVYFPARIEGAVGSTFETGHADYGGSYHEDGETEREGEGEFLGETDFDLPD
jgi:hypothetical protein